MEAVRAGGEGDCFSLVCLAAGRGAVMIAHSGPSAWFVIGCGSVVRSLTKVAGAARGEALAEAVVAAGPHAVLVGRGGDDAVEGGRNPGAAGVSGSGCPSVGLAGDQHIHTS